MDTDLATLITAIFAWALGLVIVGRLNPFGRRPVPVFAVRRG